MGKKIIPETITHYCDKCDKKMDKDKFDCSGAVSFVFRDYSGHAVNGSTSDFDLCPNCTNGLKDWFGW